MIFLIDSICIDLDLSLTYSAVKNLIPHNVLTTIIILLTYANSNTTVTTPWSLNTSGGTAM